MALAAGPEVRHSLSDLVHREGSSDQQSGPTIASQRVRGRPTQFHDLDRTPGFIRENGTPRDSAGQAGTTLNSLIMLRSQVRFLLAPPRSEALFTVDLERMGGQPSLRGLRLPIPTVDRGVRNRRTGCTETPESSPGASWHPCCASLLRKGSAGIRDPFPFASVRFLVDENLSPQCAEFLGRLPLLPEENRAGIMTSIWWPDWLLRSQSRSRIFGCSGSDRSSLPWRERRVGSGAMSSTVGK
jgi:hypothetical protein